MENIASFTSYKELNAEELATIDGGRNKLAYNIGYYAGKTVIAAGVVIGAWALI
ncbi:MULTISPECIES: bacteriocin [Lacticaseibacillus]|uniref:bacteriocin n=1 Tax=Lacticaseibacillus TaxID=2759736 RepID=UPI000A5A2F04|nr:MULTISPECIES: bacteriocin [Lacticaseibacillus]